MINYVDITNFITWWGNTVKSIVNFMINTWGGIMIRPGVSLLTFILAITVIGTLIPIIFNAPKKINIREHKVKKEKKG